MLPNGNGTEGTPMTTGGYRGGKSSDEVGPPAHVGLGSTYDVSYAKLPPETRHRFDELIESTYGDLLAAASVLTRMGWLVLQPADAKIIRDELGYLLMSKHASEQVKHSAQRMGVFLDRGRVDGESDQHHT